MEPEEELDARGSSGPPGSGATTRLRHPGAAQSPTKHALARARTRSTHLPLTAPGPWVRTLGGWHTVQNTLSGGAQPFARRALTLRGCQQVHPCLQAQSSPRSPQIDGAGAPRSGTHAHHVHTHKPHTRTGRHLRKLSRCAWRRSLSSKLVETTDNTAGVSNAIPQWCRRG